MPEYSRPELRRTLKAALSVTGSLAAACAVAAAVGVSPTTVEQSQPVRQAAVSPPSSVEAAAPGTRRGAGTPKSETRDRLAGLHDDLARAVSMGHATPEQANRFEAEVAGYITGAKQVPGTPGSDYTA